MSERSDRKVLITGGASGIGFCTAQEFAKAGCVLVLTDVQEQALDWAAAKLRGAGARVHTYAYDVSVAAQVMDMAARVQREVGDIDVLINNAGIGHSGDLVSTSLDTWKRLIEVNLLGPLHHVYAFLPRMRERRSGHIVNVSSGQAFFRLPSWGAYASIKAALGAFSEIAHFEFRRYGIHVTTVYPFMVNTPFYKNITGDTLVGRLSMKLVPYYAMSPETVGRIIFRAVKRKSRVEMVSIFNDVGFYAQMVPLAPSLMALVGEYLFVKEAKQGSAGAQA